MNKKYFKRQLTLHKLGIPINKEIQKYIDTFNELIGDPKKLEKKNAKHFSYNGHLYYKQGKQLIFYNVDYKKVLVDNDGIWIIFTERYGLTDKTIEIILSILIEDLFDYKYEILQIRFTYLFSHSDFWKIIKNTKQ